MIRTFSPASRRPSGVALVRQLWQVRRAVRLEVSEPIRRGAQNYCRGIARSLSVPHTQSLQYLSDTFEHHLAFVGSEDSLASVRAPEGKDCTERFVRIGRENLPWVRTCDAIEVVRQTLLGLRDPSNNTWLIERGGFVAPAANRGPHLESASFAMQA